MLSCCVYPLIFAIYAILLGCWLCSFLFLRLGIKTKNPVLKWIAFVPLSLITAFFLLGVFDAVWTHLPRSVYTETFGEKPSADVSGIKSEYRIGPDFERTCLQFHAEKSTFERICPSSLKEVTYDECLELLASNIRPRPKWWINVNSEMTIRLFVVDRQHPYQIRLLTYDEASKIVQYFCNY